MSQWYCMVGQERFGPVDDETLRQWAREGRIGPTSYVWTEGMPNWLPLKDIPGMGAAPAAMTHPVSLPVGPPGGTHGQTPLGTIIADAWSSTTGNLGNSLLLALMGIGIYLAFILVGSLPVIGLLGAVAQIVLYPPLYLGAGMFFLVNARRGHPRAGLVGNGFKNFGKAMGTYWFMALMLLAVIIPMVLLGVAAGILAGTVGELDEATAVVVGVIGGALILPFYIYAVFKYNLVFLIVADDPTCPVLEAFSRRRALMRGQVGRFTLLILFALLMWLVVAATLGLGFLFVGPFLGTCSARYYDDLLPPPGAEA